MIPTSLLKLGSENALRAQKMFKSILKYMSEEGPLEPASSPSKNARIDLVQQLLHQVCAPQNPPHPTATAGPVHQRAGQV